MAMAWDAAGAWEEVAAVFNSVHVAFTPKG